MDRRPSRRFKTVNTAKLALAVTLLIAFLSSIVPLASVSAGSMCVLKCCTGRTPHAAGSCMEGSCPTSILRHGKAAKNRQPKLIQAEPLCGHAHKVALKSFAQMRSGSDRSQIRSGRTTASAAAFVKPCQPDCGGGAAGFSNPNRHRNSAVIADVVRPRGPTAIHLSDFGKYRTQILEALCRQCAPRGPPRSFS